MNLKKKDLKSYSLISILIILILISNLPDYNKYGPINSSSYDEMPLKKDIDKFPNNADFNVSSYIIGEGVNQSVRVYMTNASNSLNNEKYFEIPAPADNMNLSSGDFKFNFGNNYTTDHTIENNEAISLALAKDPDRPLDSYSLRSDYSSLTISNGSGDASKFSTLLSVGTDFNITSSNGIVNFTVLANFSNIQGSFVKFFRNNIIALILNFTYSIRVINSLNKNVNITVQIKDFFTNKFDIIVPKTVVNSSISPLKIDNPIINENLNYTSLSNTSLLIFTFETTNTATLFNVTLRDFFFKSFMVHELPITKYKHVALEFDLQGLNSTVNGFYAWIRTLNVTKASNVKLNISLYRATGTISRSQTQLGTDLIEPDLINGYIDSVSIDVGDYLRDNITYFQFNPNLTKNLNRSNYFIVIKSNSSEEVFKLVTISKDSLYGDNIIEHQMKTFNLTSSNNWDNAIYPGDPRGNQQLDASSFKLNVTRGYMPSDFIINGSSTLKIQDIPVDDFTIYYPDQLNPTEPVLKWGLGQWNHNFTYPIGSISNQFRVDLEWNNTYIKGFKFDVNYTAIAFRNENATTQYWARYNLPIQWVFNYSLDLDNFDTYQWNFTELWFVYLHYFDAQNLTLPNGTNVFSRTGGEKILESNPAYNKVVVSTQIINVSKAEYSGNYSLYLTHENIITDATMHSYIKYNTTLWESRGFMFGDNISIGLDIILPSNINNGLAPSSGFANVSFFDPDGIYISNLTTSTGKISKDKKTISYDFNNQTIFEVTKNIPKQGTYSMGYFWTNGSIIGCSKVNIFIDSYNFTFDDVDYNSIDNVNTLKGIPHNNLDFPSDYILLIASVNETTNNPYANFYAINKSLSLNEGTFSYWSKGTNHEFKVFLKDFIQNESVLNPNENIQFKVTIQNRDEMYDVDVKINIKLVAYINDEWIIDENTTNNQLLTKYNPGSPGDTKEFIVDLKIPNINNDLSWKGKNAPIRQGGVKTLVTIFIENGNAGTYFSNDYSIIVNKTQDLFEGYIIALKQTATSQREFFQDFERDECLYSPAINNFVINTIDENYVSLYDMINFTKELELASIFNNILIDPENVLEGNSFNITSTLSTEFGDPLSNKTVLCQYYNGNTWINKTLGKTDINGNTDLRIETSDPDINPSVSKLFRLVWPGDISIMNKTQNFTVNILIQMNSISLSSDDDYREAYIYRNSISSITLEIKNSGTSNLRIIDIEVEIDDDVDYKIKGEDNYVLENLKTDESTTIIIELKSGMIKSSEIEIKVIITAQNILSGEIISSRERFIFGVINKPLNYYAIEYFIFIVLALFALILLTSYLYYKKLKAKIEAPIEKAELERPKKPRYVKISELKAEEMKKEVIAPPHEKEKIEEKKEVELDDLLKEKYEKEKKESSKPEEVSEKVEIPSKEVRKLSRKGKKEVKKPTEGRISTRQMVEKKRMEKKGFLKKLKKKKKETPKQKIKEKTPPAKKVEEKKKTDLDSLLEEEGLKDK